ncbi:hypothetical protein [Hydrogenophaga laconesensis]|uniref:Uncharacterized protein n=1 Tax=Hydrogenophaga laconesensis TaxID=1805971 RepID=A0ABU1V4N1_9BURK|nr:hypothetical protein [Hydrogenophaga laconesensis]MDR7092288.1 hypothetical protein [Hydrogenophaga laconesensis]
MNPSSEREALRELVTSYGFAFHAAIARPDAHDTMRAKADHILETILQRYAALSTQPQQATADLRNWGALVFPAMDQAAKTLATVECADLHEQQMMDELIEKLKSLSIQYATIVRPLPPVPGQEGGTGE